SASASPATRGAAIAAGIATAASSAATAPPATAASARTPMALRRIPSSHFHASGSATASASTAPSTAASSTSEPPPHGEVGDEQQLGQPGQRVLAREDRLHVHGPQQLQVPEQAQPPLGDLDDRGGNVGHEA